MSVITCAMCDKGFSSRSDAVYCSPACRQKAYRARTARRDRLLGGAWSATAAPRAFRGLHGSVAASVRRAREQVERSRDLCRVADRRIQQAHAIRLNFDDKRAAERAPWLGS